MISMTSKTIMTIDDFVKLLIKLIPMIKSSKIYTYEEITYKEVNNSNNKSGLTRLTAFHHIRKKFFELELCANYHLLIIKTFTPP